MRASTAIVAFSAYAGLTSAIDLSSCPTGIGYDTTPNILAIDTPALGKNVLVGNAFSITWHLLSDITDVALVLCKGPAINCVPTTCITPSTKNTGSYSYTPDTTLEASQDKGYGIKIIAIGGTHDGNFQYSSQFGISNSNPSSSSSSSAPVSPVSSDTPYSTTTPDTSSPLVSQISDGQIQAPTAPATPTQPFPTLSLSTGPYYVPAPTGQVSNITHSSGFKFSYAPNTAPPGALVNSTQFLSVTPGVSGAVPTGVLPVTSVAIATATPNGPFNPSMAPTGTGVLTSPSNAAGRVVVGGLVAGLGAVAALVL